MHSLKAMNLRGEAVKVTWCACERCLALGPHTMTLVRNGRAREVALRTDCCGTALDDRLEGDD
jgi:hypothetical protein